MVRRARVTRADVEAAKIGIRKLAGISEPQRGDGSHRELVALQNRIKQILDEKCSSYSLDDEGDRKMVAYTLADELSRKPKP